MSARRVWIVGAGKRVRETALPALLSLPGKIEIAGVCARSSRYLDVAGTRFQVRALRDLMPAECAAGDVVYVAVGKDAVPEVLERLKRLHRERLELLIDTPVMKLKHLRHAPLLTGWKKVSVAEDVVHLPWFETVRAAVGDVRSVTFDRSGYAYHGIAQSRALCGAKLVRARRRSSGGATRRELEFANGVRASVIEPRDYAKGRVVVEGARGRVTDRVEAGESAIPLEVVLEDGRCVGFRAGDVVTRLAPAEIELLAPRDAATADSTAPDAASPKTPEKAALPASAPPEAAARGATARKSTTWDAAPLVQPGSASPVADAPGASVIARMESMKRVAFRRLAVEVAEGRGGYPLEEGLEDMAVDWFLEKIGRWSAGGLCDVRRPAARSLWSQIGRLG